MKKIKIIILFITLLILILWVMNKYHFLYSTACGSGTAGLRFLAIYAGIFIIILGILQINKKTNKRPHCISCRSDIQDDWEICPYCGTTLEGKGTIQ